MPGFTSVQGYQLSIHSFLRSRGWETSGRVTTRRTKESHAETVTWWLRGGWEYPQHLALDLERRGWVKILETMP